MEWGLRGCPLAVEMAPRSLMSGELMQWVGRQGKSAGFKEVTPLLHRFLLDAWEGGSHTFIKERLNKIVRDAEQRAAPSHDDSRMGRWQRLTDSWLIPHYERTPVVAPLTLKRRCRATWTLAASSHPKASQQACWLLINS